MQVASHMNSFRFFLLSFVVLCCAIPALAQPNFTRDQAREGRAAYREHCASCHGAKLEGLHLSPALAGARFDQMWRGRSADVLALNVRRMPPETVADPGSIDDRTYANI